MGLTQLGSGRCWPGLLPDRATNPIPSITERRVVYETPHHTTYQVTAEFARFSKEYFVNDYGPHAGIVAVDRDRVLMVRQYRLLIDRVSLEVPGGGVGSGETPEQAAIRECYEETGIRCLDPQPLLSYQTDLDTIFSPVYLFHTQQVSAPSEQHKFNPSEVTGLEWVPVSRTIEMIRAGEIIDSFSILALLSYQAVV